MPVEVVAPFLRALKISPIQIEGIFTHFARADEADSDSTPEQIRLFNSLLHDLDQQGLKPEIVHAANSAAILNFPASYYDLTRPGDLIMGMSPIEGKPLPAQFKPVLTWKARLISLRTFPAGQGISYGSKYVTSKEERIGVIPIGYGDGFRRVDGQQALVGGKRVNIVGRVCMDQCMLQLDDVPDAKIGDEVVLVGGQGSEFITIDEVAQRWGTINYEVVCGLAERLPRIYIE
jgi:alanine racemase